MFPSSLSPLLWYYVREQQLLSPQSVISNLCGGRGCGRLGIFSAHHWVVFYVVELRDHPVRHCVIQDGTRPRSHSQQRLKGCFSCYLVWSICLDLLCSLLWYYFSVTCCVSMSMCHITPFEETPWYNYGSCSHNITQYHMCKLKCYPLVQGCHLTVNNPV